MSFVDIPNYAPFKRRTEINYPNPLIGRQACWNSYSTSKLLPNTPSDSRSVKHPSMPKEHLSVLKAPPNKYKWKQVPVLSSLTQIKRVYDIMHIEPISIITASFSQPMELIVFTQSTSMKDS